MHRLSKTLLIPVFVFVVFSLNPSSGITGELDIQWSNKKLSILAKNVILCDLLKELGEKTNTQIRNDNNCDYAINLNVNNTSFDEAIKKIFRKESYVLLDDDTERKLLVYNRNNNQSDNSFESPDVGMIEPMYTPESQQPTPYDYPTPQEYDQYQDSTDRGIVSPEAINPDLINTPQPPP